MLERRPASSCIFTSSRTGEKPTQNFISTTQLHDAEQIYQRYRIRTLQKAGPTGDKYFTYDYNFIGVIQDEAIGQEMKDIYDKRLKSGFVTATSMDEEAGELHAEKMEADERRQARNQSYADRRSDRPMKDIIEDDVPFLKPMKYNDEGLHCLCKNQRRSRILSASKHEGWSPGDL